MSNPVDSRLAFASTLSSRFYTDPSFLPEENRKVFGRTWQLVGHEEQVREPGQFFVTKIGDEPLLILRGADGELRALSNVCRHRAGPVVKGSGQRRVLQCGYHGWTYALDGTLLTTPEMEEAQQFDRAGFCLPQFRVEAWNGLLFVNLHSGAESLRNFLGAALFDHFGKRDYQGYRLAARKEWELGCNWKVYVDNYLEGYHIPIVHPSLFRELDYPNYWTETKRHYSIQHAPLKRADRIRTTASGDDVSYYWIYPNLMLNVYPDNFSTNVIVPLGHERTLTIFEWYFRDPESPEVKKAIDDTIAFSDEIQREDIEICEAVQRGLRSATYTNGRYSPKRENGVHHFHQLYRDAMGLSIADS